MADTTTQSQGTSSSSGYSSSLPVSVQSPQSQWGLQLSQLLGALTQNQYAWAQQQYNMGLGVTDANINQYMQEAQQGAGLAQNLLGRYQNVFEPLMNQYIAQAGSYNSEARQRFMMGQAESTAGQADQAAMDSAQRQLQGFGVNPNSGRYQDLLLTSRLQDAATRAGAGTQASVNTANTGRQMEQTALGWGQNEPGMAVNALQSAYTGITGAENAILGQQNTGANLLNTVPNFGNAAANANRLPPVGQQSQSQQRSGSQNSSQGQGNKQPNQSSGQGAGKGSQTPDNTLYGGANPGGGGGMSAANQIGQQTGRPVPKDQQDQNGGDYATAGGLDLGPVNPSDIPSWLNNPTLTDNPFGAGSPNQATSPDNTNWPAAGPQQIPMGFGQGPGTSSGGVSSEPYYYQPGTFPTGQGGDLAAQAGINDIGSNLGQFNDTQPSNAPQSSWWDPTTPANAGDMPSGPGQQFPGDQSGQYTPPPDQSSFRGQYQPGMFNQPQDQSGGQYAPPPQDTSGGYTPPADTGGQYAPPPDMGGGGGGGDYSGGYASGGVIPNQTSGGFVPTSASPSQGRRTDDIPARLNAKEFVIPRDVTEHLGTKHFSDLIAKSRKARTGMAGPPPQGKMKPALRMRPTFTSHYTGAR
jgi:hypothetical protein